MNVSNWEGNINDDNEGIEYNNNSTKEAARNNSVKQPKGLLGHSEDSITTNSGANTVIATSSKKAAAVKATTIHLGTSTGMDTKT